MQLLQLFVGFLFLVGICIAQNHYSYDNPPLRAGSFIDTVYTASLSFDQVVPMPVGNENGFGTSFCKLDRNTNILFCHVCHTVTSPISATISVGERLTNGPSIYSFNVPPTPFFEEAFQLKDQPGYPLYSQLQDFLFGRWYITVFSEEEEFHIRGQLEQVNNVYAYMTSEDTFPAAFGAPHRGVTLGFYTSHPKRQANYDVCHDVDDATYAVVGRGVPGYPGEFVFDFRDPIPPISAEFQYTINDEQELETGYQYTQIRSEQNPQGAVRGQLSFVQPLPSLTVTGRMDGNQAGVRATLARGCILISYDCNTRDMEYLIYHSVQQPTALEVRIGPPGFTGTLLFTETPNSLNLAAPIYGRRTLTAEEEWILYAEQMYFLLTSINFPDGEIRGQLTTQYDFFAHLTGIQVVPPVSTPNVGCATFDLIDYNFNLDYEILHSIEDAVSVNMYEAAFGVNAETDTVRSFVGGSVLGTTTSPLIGELIMDDDDQAALILDNLYVQIASDRFPEGEIRGQILRILPCDPSPYAYSKSSESFSFGSYGSLIELPIDRDNGIILLPCFLMVFSFILLFI